VRQAHDTSSESGHFIIHNQLVMLMGENLVCEPARRRHDGTWRFKRAAQMCLCGAAFAPHELTAPNLVLIPKCRNRRKRLLRSMQ